jgi:hypothetical protein
MQRRNFIKTTGIAAAGAIAAPYLLPSGRLFAASGTRKANHVVFCLFAGGVRNFESIQKAEGNLMPNMLVGSESITPDIASSIPNLPVGGQRLQTLGTLYKEFRYAQGPTGHFNGHTTAITGRYNDTDLNLKSNPEYPTVFELYRKHNSPSQTALNAWWISNQLGPYPALNYSKFEGYGADYGANYIQPTTMFDPNIGSVMGNPKQFNQSELAKAKGYRDFLNNNFANQYTSGDAGVVNPEADNYNLQQFLNSTYAQVSQGGLNDPWGIGQANMNGDSYNILFAEKIIQQYKPELLVVNMQGVDIGHTNFTEYCANMRRADYAVWHLWQTIQSTPGMANDTILIIAPEHGRNLQANSIIDSHGRYALDHTSDQKSREIFCMVVGPPSVVNQNQIITAVEGESIDIVPTIADILGFANEIPPAAALPGSPLQAAFV